MGSSLALLLSIRPRFVEQIFDGSKTVELRRIRPKVKTGDLVVVYSSGSQKALVGAFQVRGVLALPPEKIWKRFGANTGLTKEEFDDYFEGVPTAFAIEVGKAWPMPVPIQLATLRRKRGGFHAPQSYRYLDADEVSELGGKALLGRMERRTKKCASSNRSG